LLGFLNTNRDRIARLIDQGFDDAVSHDCAESDCVLAGEGGQAEGGEIVPQAGLLG
jgi:hypothetical protein